MLCSSSVCLPVDYNKMDMPRCKNLKIDKYIHFFTDFFYRNGPYPLEIQFQMRLMDIFEINPTDFSIVVSVYFSFRWTENRLIINTNKSYISLDLEFIKNLWVYEQGAK